METQVKNTSDKVLEDYADIGFHLVLIVEADTFIDLYFKEDFIARFNQVKVTKEILWTVCQEYLDGLNGKGEPIEI